MISAGSTQPFVSCTRVKEPGVAVFDLMSAMACAQIIPVLGSQGREERIKEKEDICKAFVVFGGMIDMVYLRSLIKDDRWFSV